MYYYFDTVFLFRVVVPAGSIVSAYIFITSGEEGRENILVSNFSH